MSALIENTDKRVIILYFIGAFLALLVLNVSSLAIILPFSLLFILGIIISPDVAYYAIFASIPIALEVAGGLTVTTLVMPMAVMFLFLNACVHRCSWPISITGREAKFALLFFFSVVISGLLSANVGHAFKDGLVVIVFFIIFYTSLSYINDESSFRKIFWVLIITGVVEAIITVAQVKIGFTLPGKWRLTNMESADLGSEFRADGTTAHPILLAHFLLFTIVVSVAEIMWTQFFWKKVLLVIAVGLMLIAMYYAYSRTAFIALGVTVGMALLMRGKIWRNVILVAALFTVMFVLALKVHSIDDLLNRIEALSFFSSSASQLDLNPSSDSYGFRMEQFVASWGLFQDHPIIGVGFDQAIRYYEPYLPTWAVNYFHPQVIHNIFLQVMCELGIIGSIAFIGLWVSALLSIKNAWAHEQFGRYAKLIFLILIGQLVMGNMNPMMREIWLSLAMASAIGKLALTNKSINNFAAMEQSRMSDVYS